MEIPEWLKDRIQDVADIIGDETNDWLVIKTALIRYFPNEGRKLFSIRHEKTKKQLPNDFDRLVMNHWKMLTGVEPFLDPQKIHDPNWVWKKKGWALNQKQKKISHEKQ